MLLICHEVAQSKKKHVREVILQQALTTLFICLGRLLTSMCAFQGIDTSH